jgi:hypothetical protein
MHLNINEFIEEQKKGLAEMVENLSKSRVAAARNAARESAARMKSLNARIRELARSGVRLTVVSQGAAQGFIELQEEIVNSALTDAAKQIERMAYTENVRELARMQGEVLQAARQRIVDDIARTVTMLKTAAGDVRKAVARPEPAAPAAPRRKKAAARGKAKVAARRKSAARSKAKTAPRSKKAPMRRKAAATRRGKAPAKGARRKSARR